MLTKEAWGWAAKTLSKAPGVLRQLGKKSVKDTFSPISMGIHGLTLASGMDGATNSVGGFLGGSLGYNAAARLTRKIPGPGWLRGGINLVAGTLAGIKGSTLANKVTNRLPQGYKRELPLALRPYSN